MGIVKKYLDNDLEKETIKFMKFQDQFVPIISNFIKGSFFTGVKGGLADLTLIKARSVFAKRYETIWDTLNKCSNLPNVSKTAGSIPPEFQAKGVEYFQSETMIGNYVLNVNMQSKAEATKEHKTKKEATLHFDLTVTKSDSKSEKKTITVNRKQLIKMVEASVNVAKENKKMTALKNKLTTLGSVLNMTAAVTGGISTILNILIFSNYRLTIVGSRMIAATSGPNYYAVKREIKNVIKYSEKGLK